MAGLVTMRFKKGFNAKKATTDLRTRVPIIINDAIGIIKKDITDGIKKGIDINNRPFVPLKPATIARKRKKRTVGNKKLKASEYPSRALWDQGIMQNTYLKTRANISRPVAILRIAEKRINPAEIGKFHQKGKGNNPQREWFGMSPRAEATINKMLKLNVSRMLDDEFHIR